MKGTYKSNGLSSAADAQSTLLRAALNNFLKAKDVVLG